MSVETFKKLAWSKIRAVDEQHRKFLLNIVRQDGEDAFEWTNLARKTAVAMNARVIPRVLHSDDLYATNGIALFEDIVDPNILSFDHLIAWIDGVRCQPSTISLDQAAYNRGIMRGRDFKIRQLETSTINPLAFCDVLALIGYHSRTIPQ